jgi:hypothetical protein
LVDRERRGPPLKGNAVRNLTAFASLLIAGTVAFAAAPGCSSSKESGFSNSSSGGGQDKDVYVPPIGTSGGDEDGGITGEGCGGGEVAPTKVPVYFMFAADGSGSMIGAKWDGQVAALKAVFEDIKNQTAAQIGRGEQADTVAGLIVFADSLDRTSGQAGPYPGGNDILPRAITNTTELSLFWGRLGGQADDLTPTKAALTGAYQTIEAYNPEPNVKPNGKRVVILLSDGQPSDDSPSGSIHSLAATKAAQARPVFTYAIGVGNGSSYSPKFMADLAIRGKTAPTTCNPNLTNNPDCFYQIDPSGGKPASQIQAEMVMALNNIRSLASQCDLALTLVDKDGNPADPKRVQVTYDDGNGKETVIPKDPANGWQYDDENNPTRIILNGNSCVQARANEKGKTIVKMGCKVAGG